MAYFLASVGRAKIFKGEELFATAKTLTDSSITIGVSSEEVRAGQGAKLYGKYFHTSTFDLKMTDAMFRMEYIAANVGAELEIGGDIFASKELTADATGKITLPSTAVPMVSGGTVYAYAKKPVDDNYATYVVSADNKITGLVAGDTYCVEYLETKDDARKMQVKANFTPDTLSVYLTSNLYSGDDTNPSTGTRIGEITIKVPRFLLSGSQELSMNMTGAATTSFEGSALASNAKGCDGEAIYAEIIEVIDGRKWTDFITDLIVDGMGPDKTISSTSDMVVYGIAPGYAPKKIASKDLNQSTSGSNVTISLKEKPSVKLTLTIA